jgi:hypothetical protein
MVLIIPATLHAVVRRYPQLAMTAHYPLGAIGPCLDVPVLMPLVFGGCSGSVDFSDSGVLG